MAPARAQHLRFLHGSQQAAASAKEAGEARGGRQGRQGLGCARACQRVPGVIYDVRPMSLSSGLFQADCIQQLDRQASLPPGPPSHCPYHWLMLPGPVSFGFSVILFPCLCLSAFLGFCVPTSPGSVRPPNSIPSSESPWLSPMPLTLAASPVYPPHLSVSASVSLSLSLPLALSLLLIPLALASHVLPDLLPFTPGSGHRNRVPEGDVEEEPFPFLVPHLLGRSWAAGLVGEEDRVPGKWEGGARGERGSPRGNPPSAARARPLLGVP